MRVYYEDVDVGGILYHSKYLNFCERARSELFFSKGQLPIEDGYHFVVKHIDADFLKPAKFGDALTVTTEIKALKRASLILRQTIHLQATKLFTMDVQLVCIKDEKPTVIPPSFQEIFASI